ncbi:MAG: arsenate reductase family protein [Phascolarctobacterium sp.]|nr:arsenate reductase family protein [Phascolarctobacterium sp.]
MRENILFICYTKCSTCKKAEKWLKNHGILFTMRDIKENKPMLKELTSWYKASGLPLKRFFNTSGNLYKALHLKEKLQDMSELEQLKLLASDGMLVKRPILVTKNFVLVGFREAEWQEKI